MNSDQLIKHNLEILLIAIESLQPHGLDELDKHVNLDGLSSLDIFILRTQHIGIYNKTPSSSFQKTFIMLEHILNIICKQDIQKNITSIIKEYAWLEYQQYSLSTENYFRRFEYNYRKAVQPYLIGNYSYNQPQAIQKKSLLILIIMNKIYSVNGIYLFINYLTYYNTKSR